MKSANGPARIVVSPCLLVDSIEDELRFIRVVFGARTSLDHGVKQARLGDTIIRIGQAPGGNGAAAGMLQIWMDDVDGTFKKAIAAGATLISEPMDKDTGVREAGFRDPQGVVWWISRRTGKLTAREIEARLRDQRKARL